MNYETVPDTDTAELVPVELQAYEDDAELDVDNSNGEPTIENHHELVEEGLVYGEVTSISRSCAEAHNLCIVEEGDDIWDERLEDLDPSDSWRLEELR